MKRKTNNNFQPVIRTGSARNAFLFSVISFSFLLSAIGLIFLPQNALAQTPEKMTNKEVIKLVKAGIPIQIISQTIKVSGTEFDTSPSGLQDLRKQSVPDSIVSIMLEKQGMTSAATSLSIETQPQGTGDLKTKKAGVVRIGIVTTVSNVPPEQDDAVRAQLYEMLYGNRETSAVEAVLLKEKLTRNILNEANMAGCDYVLQLGLESTIQSTEKRGNSFLSNAIKIGGEAMGIANRNSDLFSDTARITYRGYQIANSLQRSNALLDAITKSTKKKDKVGINFALVKVSNNEATIPNTLKEKTAQQKQEPILQNLLVEVGNQILNAIPNP